MKYVLTKGQKAEPTLQEVMETLGWVPPSSLALSLRPKTNVHDVVCKTKASAARTLGITVHKLNQILKMAL